MSLSPKPHELLEKLDLLRQKILRPDDPLGDPSLLSPGLLLFFLRLTQGEIYEKGQEPEDNEESGRYFERTPVEAFRDFPKYICQLLFVEDENGNTP